MRLLKKWNVDIFEEKKQHIFEKFINKLRFFMWVRLYGCFIGCHGVFYIWNENISTILSNKNIRPFSKKSTFEIFGFFFEINNNEKSYEWYLMVVLLVVMMFVCPERKFTNNFNILETNWDFEIFEKIDFLDFGKEKWIMAFFKEKHNIKCTNISQYGAYKA